MNPKRVLLKLSGETLSGNGNCVDGQSIQNIADELKDSVSGGIQFAIVIGAGNIWRGAGKSIDRVSADKMGMLATVMNAIALSDVFNANGMKSVVLCAAGVSGFCEVFSRQKAEEYFSKGYIIIFAGGIGNPFFTTDTTAALRACEIKADVILKATQVDGIYTADPKKDSNAVKYEKISFKEAIDKNLKIMDISAFSLCMENKISIYVFDFHKKGNLFKILNGHNIGTVVL